ncbi:Glycine oxidase [Baekduia alba]|uniref:glycine oxidase ThiO n=1 Tax=Baekduia alba TaxID=2997333 RepID=UPI002340F845|nr:glycine oxidase ThiO [Baekduia alba]WCB91631.1 Glycine oxidase [Baekduia alba]
MTNPLPHADVAVVGGGVIGLAVAWRARQRGLDVLLIDRGDLGAGASRAAAGMLAPVAEADAQERALLVHNLESARRWPAFAAELGDVTGVDVGYRACGSLLLARDRDEAEHVERERALRERMGLKVERLLGSEARRREPALAPSLRLALALPDDHAVEPIRVTAALIEACVRAGVHVRAGTDVSDLATLPAERVVIATGAWAGESRRMPVRPVKGQALRLRDPSGPGLCDRVLRWGPPTPGYLVPRGDGRYYLGATMEERGFDTAVTALGVYELLRDAGEVIPGLLELEIEEALAGLRPGTPDNAPIVGTDPADERIVWATGHFRNGILLCPLTAELVADELTGGRPDHALRPERFAAEGAPA